MEAWKFIKGFLIIWLIYSHLVSHAVSSLPTATAELRDSGAKLNKFLRSESDCTSAYKRWFSSLKTSS